MTGKIVDIPVSPRRVGAREGEDAWVRGEDPGKAGKPLKRLTIEIDEAMHRRVKVAAAQEGCTMSTFARRLFDRACPP